MNENICAISTALGVGAISIVRCSGPDVINIVNKILDTENPVSFDITTDKPLSPPGAIVCGTKNIFSPTDIIIHAVISPMYSTKILL